MVRQILFLTILLLATSVFADAFDYSAYQDTNLGEAAANMHIDPRVDYWFDAAHPRYHSVAVFSGDIRPISEDTRRFVEAWAEAMGHASQISSAFQHEARFMQDDASYWMPVQAVLVEPLRSEVKAGGKSHLYLLLMGAWKKTPVFAISEFDAIEPE
jgi:hypothetical protein